ncbi:MAG: hypothetical protein EXR93_08500 [Gemmatimonadetes bacterium]|nr:hypothetical protein [Gemmatimonadota bacterium]
MRIATRILVAIVLAVIGIGPQLGAQTMRTVAGNRQIGSQTELDVTVEFAAGRLTIGRDETGMLYRAKVVYDEEQFEPLLDYSAADHTLRVGVDGIRGTHGKDHDGKQELRLDVTPKVPVTFDIKFGAAKADLDLGGLNLRRAEVNTGATDATVRFSTPTTGRCDELTFHVGAAQFKTETLGNSRCQHLEFMGGVGGLTLDFSGDWGGVTRPTADISVGLGSLTLRLPRNVGVQIDISGVFSSFDRSGMIKRDGAYFSPNYDTATTKLVLNVKSALGSVDVAWR